MLENLSADECAYVRYGPQADMTCSLRLLWPLKRNRSGQAKRDAISGQFYTDLPLLCELSFF